nr:hypothetical protein [Tanacetum cinerariifolium]
GSTTTHSDISLLEYEAFYDDPFPPADRSDFYELTDELIPFISPPEYDCFLFKVAQLDGFHQGCGGGYFSNERTTSS